jgi:2,4-dienoyl-CoA reductase-like NADH-dependent reductase (Old Yellow Enzyme family)
MVGPATLLYAEDNVLSQRHIDFYGARAAGGAGLIVSEEHAVHPSALGAFRHSCTAWDPRAVAPMARLAEAVHAHGARQLVQLYAPGLADSAGLMLDERGPLWGPSRVSTPDAGEMGMAMGPGEIAQLVDGFAASARNVEVAGLDGVEIHAAHGWLVGQFLSPLFNRRSDGYGATVAGRCRLAVEIGEAIRARTRGLVLGIQLSVDEHVGPAGITPEEADLQIDLLAATGLFDYVSLSTGSQFSRHRTIAPMGTPDAVLEEHGRRARALVDGRVAVAVLGSVRDLRTAARLVASGAADLVGLTRAHLADPELTGKARSARDAEVVPCVGANECLSRAFAGRAVSCVLNPATGRERTWGPATLRPAPAPRRVTVVGAGPAGLRAAAIAARRGHDVTLLERETALGGHLELLSRLPGRGAWSAAIAWMEREALRAGARLLAGHEATPASVSETEPDAVLLAAGARWDVSGEDPGRPGAPPIPIAPGVRALDVETALRRALEDPLALGTRIAVIDEASGPLALGLAEVAAAGGARVDVVSRHAVVGARVHAALEAPDLLARLAPLDVHLVAGHAVASIGRGALRLEEVWSGRESSLAPVDTVVLALLRSPRDELAGQLGTVAGDVRVVGDALVPRATAEVLLDGERTGRAL